MSSLSFTANVELYQKSLQIASVSCETLCFITKHFDSLLPLSSVSYLHLEAHILNRSKRHFKDAKNQIEGVEFGSSNEIIEYFTLFGK